MVATSEERIAEIFVGNHMPAKDIQQTSFNPEENPHANHSPYLPFAGKFAYLSPTPFLSYFPAITVFYLAIQGLEISMKISISLEAKDTNIRILVFIATILLPA